MIPPPKEKVNWGDGPFFFTKNNVHSRIYEQYKTTSTNNPKNNYPESIKNYKIYHNQSLTVIKINLIHVHKYYIN